MVPFLVVLLPVVVLLISFPRARADAAASVATTTRKGRLTYAARLNEDVVHSYGVRRMWSSRRYSDESTRIVVNEHDPDAKREFRSYLLRRITDAVVSHLFVGTLGTLTKEEQIAVMTARRSSLDGTVRRGLEDPLADALPNCGDEHGDDDDDDDDELERRAPRRHRCTVRFASLAERHGVSWDVDVTLVTRYLPELSDAEIRERVEATGRTRPVEFDSILLVANVTAPDLSEETVWTSLIKRVENFLAVSARDHYRTEDLGVVNVTTIAAASTSTTTRKRSARAAATSNLKRRDDDRQRTTTRHKDRENDAGVEEKRRMTTSSSSPPPPKTAPTVDRATRMANHGMAGLEDFLRNEANKEVDVASANVALPTTPLPARDEL